MKLLLVDDEIKLVNALSHLLKINGYLVDTATDGETGLEMAVTENYDLIILDRMLPGRDGLSVIKEIRSQKVNTPVIFLTVMDTPQDRVEGLDAGADDYLTKPFSTEELLARLRALTRRKSKELVESTVTAAGMTLDPLKCEVLKDGEKTQLSVKEALLLELLMRNRGNVVKKELIYEKIWGYYSDTKFGNVDLYIHYLRKKLNTSSIKTVRGIGYFIKTEADA